MAMKATDMRSVYRAAREERRVQVIRLRKAGHTYDEIARQTSLTKTGVFHFCKRYADAGSKGLKDARPDVRPVKAVCSISDRSG